MQSLILRLTNILRPMKKKFSGRTTLLVAALISVAGKAAAGIGKIPLSGALGASGAGLYFAAFPLYGLIVALTSGGICSCVSAFVAEESDAISRKTIATLFFWEILTALVPALLVFFLAGSIARAQNLPEAAGVYRSLCPSVVVCAAYSVIRGTLLGKRAFVRSAFAELVSQAVKAIISPVFAVAGGLISPRFIAPCAALGTLAAESAALIFALVSFFKTFDNKNDACDKAAVKRIYLKSLPVALTGIITPLCALADSFIVPGILCRVFSRSQATSLYGIKEGAAGSLLSLPSSVYAVAYAYFLPILSANKNKKDVTVVFGAYFFVGLIIAFTLYFLSGKAVAALFPSLSAEHTELAISLIKIGASGAFFAAITQAFTTLFHSSGKTATVAVIRIAGGIFRVAACAICTSAFGIHGAVLAQMLSSAGTAAVISVIGAIALKPTINLTQYRIPALSAGLFILFLSICKSLFLSCPPLLSATLSCAVAVLSALIPFILSVFIKRARKNGKKAQRAEDKKNN